jgi:hypothetical protein
VDGFELARRIFTSHAKRYRLNPSYVNQILNGKRQAGPTFLKALGLRNIYAKAGSARACRSRASSVELIKVPPHEDLKMIVQPAAKDPVGEMRVRGNITGPARALEGSTFAAKGGAAGASARANRR